MNAHYTHLAMRLLNVPLAIAPDRIAAIAATLRGVGSGNAVLAYGSRPATGQNVSDDANGRPANRPYQVVAGVAIIPVAGTLVQRSGALAPYLDSGIGIVTGYDGIRANLSLAFNDASVRAVVLDIDSPGGQVAGCLDLADAIYNARGQKPMWAILSETAYSAAYALASACDRVIAPRTGGTGSVGVIVAHTDISKALGNAGLTVTLIASGSRKADGNEYEPLSREAYRRIQSEVNTIGELFVRTVARNRNMPAVKVRATQGATFLGARGVDAGFADAVASPDAAFATLLQSLSDTRHGRGADSRQIAHTASQRTAKRSCSRLAFDGKLARAVRVTRQGR